MSDSTTLVICLALVCVTMYGCSYNARQGRAERYKVETLIAQKLTDPTAQRIWAASQLRTAVISERELKMILDATKAEEDKE